ncbi:hypothetical protein [Pseudaquabacterium rugosum]|uniref:Uncharacterized protein n=1 Tax=Pseudaquabacterium rugosum TaxID=2984194 RepID=A0ABU9BG61_9BURK
MTHALHVWAGEARVATIEHEARDDHWGLRYESSRTQITLRKSLTRSQV